MKINYLVGDATAPVGDDRKIIVHNCNSIGVWGAGFVVAISQKWKSPEAYYKRWYELGKCPLRGTSFQLGQIQLVKVEPKLQVCNLIGQSGCGHFYDLPPVRYEAINEGLIRLREHLKVFSYNIAIHAPRLGAGISGGDWNKVEEIINSVFEQTKHPFYVYDLPSGV